MAEDNTGIGTGIGSMPQVASAPTAPPTTVQTFLDTQKAIRDRKILATNMDAVAARKAELANYLGATDYAKKLADAQGMGKLQLALALAQRGFAAAGAAPARGESPVSTLSRELFSPLAGDAGAVATQMMQQKQAMNAAQEQEERQLKLAALQDVQTRDTAYQDLALKLMPAPKTDTGISTLEKNVLFNFGAQAIVGNVVVFRSKDGTTQIIRTLGEHKTDDGTVIPAGTLVSGFSKTVADKTDTQGTRGFARRIGDDRKPTGPVFPVNYTYNGSKYTARAIGSSDETPLIFEGDGINSIYTNEKGETLGSGTGTGTDTYKDHLVVVDVATGKPVIDDLGKWVEVSRRGNKLYRFGTTEEYVQPDKTRFRPISDFNVTADGETDADKASENRLGLLRSAMNQIQVSKLPGAHSAYSARSGLFFDQSAYLAGEFAFKYIPPGTAPDDRSRDITITNPQVIETINGKMNALANTILKSDFGSSNQELRKERLSEAVRLMLSVTPATLFGAQAIERMGIDSNGNIVGYNPSQEAFYPAVVAANAESALDILQSDPGADASKTMAVVPPPDNEQDFNKIPGRLRIATEVFPNAFSNTGQAGTDAYDPLLVQGRLDVERVLLAAPLVFGASPAEHRILIQGEANKQADARATSQQSSATNDAYEMYIQRMEFRRALLDFHNAAAETNVEGFITGTVAGGLSRIGLADWIAGDGVEHWNRLSIASERFQEGQSRRVGKEFGDDRISNYDAKSYQKLVADIRSGKAYNKVLIADGLRRVNRELTDLMSLGGKVGWTERDLERAAEAGVDFSALNTQMNWHGYGYYGQSRYATSRQYTPALSDAQRNVLRINGQLRDTMYGGQYTVPNVGYLTDNEPRFILGQDETDTRDAVTPTQTLRMGPIQLEKHLAKLAQSAGVDIEEMRRRVVRSIVKYNIWRDTLK